MEVKIQAADRSVEIGIRPFTMADYEAVWQLWEICHIHPGPQDRQEEVRKKLQRDPDLFLVAEANNIVMGAVMGAWDGRNGWIYNHAVDPRSRRLRLGSRLLEELEKRLKAKGAIRIRLLVEQGNFDGQSFYEINGYKEVEEIVMSRWLNAEKGEKKGV